MDEFQLGIVHKFWFPNLAMFAIALHFISKSDITVGIVQTNEDFF